MEKLTAEGLMDKYEATLIACLTDQEVVIGSHIPLKPGYSYLLTFGEPFDRILVRAVVCYSRLMGGLPRRFEIGLFIPDPAAGWQLGERARWSAKPLDLLGYPKLLGVAGGDESPGYSPEATAAAIALRDRTRTHG